MAFSWRVASWTLCSVNNFSNCSRRQGTDIAGFAKMQAEKETNTNPIKTNKWTKNNPQSKQHPLKATRHCLHPVANVPSGLKTEWGSPPRAGVHLRAGGALEVGGWQHGASRHKAPVVRHWEKQCTQLCWCSDVFFLAPTNSVPSTALPVQMCSVTVLVTLGKEEESCAGSEESGRDRWGTVQGTQGRGDAVCLRHVDACPAPGMRLSL